MNLPVVVRSVGRMDDTREIYLEDYVAAYLNQWEKNRAAGSVILYGKRRTENGKDIFIINGAGEEGLVREGGFFAQEKEVGCLNRELWTQSGNEWHGLLAGDRKGGQPVAGYHIFYEDNEAMKEYLSFYYQRQRKEGDLHPDADLPELKALSRKEGGYGEDRFGPYLFYSLLRVAVISIFIILCAIAVSTVNSYEKLKEFTETAVQVQDEAKGQNISPQQRLPLDQDLFPE